MRKIIVILTAVILLCTISCSKAEKTPENSDTSNSAGTETLKMISSESGRLCAIEAPDGWELAHSSSEDQLVYIYIGEDESEDDTWREQLWINFYEYDTPDELVATQKSIMEERNSEYTVEDKEIGGITFRHVIRPGSYSMLFGTKDGVTISISIDPGISVNDSAVIDIINSISVKSEM